MLSQERSDHLTRIENDAPMGQMLRRYWIPACLSEEIAEPDGKPVRVRLLGEDLVAWRDTEGRVGLMDEHCPHRRSSLVLGRNEECGLRCLYHGWKFDVEGNLLDTPSEPTDSKLKEKVKHKAYPTRESGGFVWAYMGPAEKMPKLTPPPWSGDPAPSIATLKIHEEANWVQALEGVLDSAHSSSLHSSSILPAQEVHGSTEVKGAEFRITRPSEDKAPAIEVQFTDYGFRYAAIRKPIKNADESRYVRTTVYIAPFTGLIPPHDTFRSAQVFVPMDDYNTMFYFVAWSEAETLDQEKWRRDHCAVVGVDLDENYRKLRNLGNLYGQDRALMKAGDFSGIVGIPYQDMAMQESMGRIVDRSKETLGAIDIAVARLRTLLLASLSAFSEGADPIGVSDAIFPHADIKSFEGIVPIETSWRSLGVSPGETDRFRDKPMMTSAKQAGAQDAT